MFLRFRVLEIKRRIRSEQRIKEKGIWKRLRGSWQQHVLIHRREPEGLAAEEGREILVALRGPGTSRKENRGGGGRESGRSREKRKRLRIEIPNGQATRTQPC